jgi:hypothetical protein
LIEQTQLRRLNKVNRGFYVGIAKELITVRGSTIGRGEERRGMGYDGTI